MMQLPAMTATTTGDKRMTTYKPLPSLAFAGDTIETLQAITLACDAVCTAIAAKRGLWQAES